MNVESNARLNEELDEAIRLTDGMVIYDCEKLSGRRGQTFEAPLYWDRPLRRAMLVLTHMADAEGRAPSFCPLHEAIEAAVKKYSELMAAVPPQFARRPWLEEGRRGVMLTRNVSLFGYPALLTCSFDDATGEHVVRLRSLHADPVKALEETQLAGLASLAVNVGVAVRSLRAAEKAAELGPKPRPGNSPADLASGQTVAVTVPADCAGEMCCIYFTRRTVPGDKDSIEHVAELQYKGKDAGGHDLELGPRRGTGPTQLAALAQLLAGLLHDQ